MIYLIPWLNWEIFQAHLGIGAAGASPTCLLQRQPWHVPMRTEVRGPGGAGELRGASCSLSPLLVLWALTRPCSRGTQVINVPAAVPRAQPLSALPTWPPPEEAPRQPALTFPNTIL